MECLDKKRLSSYLDQGLSVDERNKIEEHISRCNQCLDFLLVAYEAQKAPKKCPAALRQKVKVRLGLRATKKRSELKWLITMLFFFALSFLFKRYFLQLLMAAVILGFKWVMEGEGARRAIMIFKGIQKSEDQQKKFERRLPPGVSDVKGGDRYGEKQ